MENRELNRNEARRYVELLREEQLAPVMVALIGEAVGIRDEVLEDNEILRSYGVALALQGQLNLRYNSDPVTGVHLAATAEEISALIEERNQLKTDDAKDKRTAKIRKLQDKEERIPAVVFNRADQKAEAKVNALRRSLERDVARGHAAREKLAEKMQESISEAIRAIGWSDKDLAEMYYAEFAQRALAWDNKRNFEGKVVTLEEALDDIVESLRGELLNDYLPGNSTGYSHRAEEAAKRAAASNFVRWYGGGIRRW